MKQIQWAGLVVLTAFLLFRGIIPALKNVGTDFPNYYASARLLVSGNDMSRLYDDDWFQQQIYRYGMDQLGKFSPFPPVTAFVMVPFVFLSPQNALRIWTLINCVLLCYAISLVSKITGKTWIWSSLLILLSGHALANNIRFGQFYLVLAVLVLAGYEHWIKHNSVRSGFLFGIGAAIKYFPILFFIEFAARREWKLVAAGIVTVLTATLLSILVIGPAAFGTFIQSVFGPHLQGNIQNPFSPTFQSWNSLFRRLFISNPLYNPVPAADSSVGFVLSLAGVYCIVVGLLVVTLRRSVNVWGKNAQSVQFALLGIGGLLLLPASATYHFLLLALPVALLLAIDPWTTLQKVVAVIYVVIGFTPYHFFERFQSDGYLIILSYPRLLLMSALFAASIAIVWKGRVHHPGRAPALAGANV